MINSSGRYWKISSLEILVVMSLLWGVGYPEHIRYPIFYFYSIIFLCFNFSNKINIRHFFCVLIITLLTAAVSNYASSIYYAFAVCLYVVLLINAMRSNLVGNDSTFDILKAASIAATLNSLILLYQINFSGKLFNSGAFPEPSHLGYTLGPILALLIIKKTTRVFGLINTAIIGVLSPSTTLLFGLLLFFYIWSIRSLSRKLLLLFLILSSLVLMIIMAYASISQISLIELKAGSLQVWFYGFVRAIEIYTDGNFFGLGPFGWIPEDGEIDATSLTIELLNQRDFASIIPFGLASYGILFPVGFFVYFSTLANYNRNDDFDQILSLLLISYLIIFCYRWAGFTLSPALLITSLLFAYRLNINLISRRKSQNIIN